MKNLILAHYYAPIEVQKIAHHVGDSLELARVAMNENVDRIVFAGVRFMAETAKILNPKAEVVIPDYMASCSLVEQTDNDELRNWRGRYYDHTHVMYINSSAAAKATADWIVTSRNVEPVIRHLLAKGEKVMFSPDRNMGAYLNKKLGINMPIWSAVCEVHDRFDREALDLLIGDNPDESRIIMAHPESPMAILDVADLIASTKGMLEAVKKIEDDVKVFVATEYELLLIMREARPDLKIVQVPEYTGCKCVTCPYMKRNTMESVQNAINGEGGTVIDYIPDDVAARARMPIERMINFNETDMEMGL